MKNIKENGYNYYYILITKKKTYLEDKNYLIKYAKFKKNEIILKEKREKSFDPFKNYVEDYDFYIIKTYIELDLNFSFAIVSNRKYLIYKLINDKIIGVSIHFKYLIWKRRENKRNINNKILKNKKINKKYWNKINNYLIYK